MKACSPQILAREAPAAARERIAILGGGIASLTTAFALTDTPALRERYEVTVYQEGWLLGGKGASVRNRQAHGRIEEHGLHVWLGHYENAFTLLRRCYEELGRSPGEPQATLREAFLKHSAITVENRTESGFEHWGVTFPETDEWPGEGREAPSLADCVRVCARNVLLHALAWWRRLRGQSPALDDAAEQLQSLLEPALEGGPSRLSGPGARVLGEGLRRLLSRLLGLGRVDHAADVEWRRLSALLDLLGTCVVGCLRDGITRPGADLEALDTIELSDWLRRHGASEATISSGLMRGFYHLVFADGDGIGAGLGLLGMLRLFGCYRGAIFYKMRAGMGETVIAPLYEVLSRRGVRFEFFHRVQNLALSADGRRVEEVVVGRQATVKAGEYRPLVDVDGLPCWPERPLYDQLVEGEDLARSGDDLASFWSAWPDVEERTLELGADFDHVVLGISIGALPFVASELIAASPRWQRMIEHVKTVRTASVQLWTTEPVDRLAARSDAPILTSYQAPLETWADMSHLLPMERSSERAGVRGILYACGQLGHGGDPVAPRDPRDGDRQALERVAHGFLEQDLAHLWPRATDAGSGMRWDALFDPQGRAGSERLRAQYLRVNASPSERYVLSVPGSRRHRLAPGDSGFDRLVLAGDWTRNGYDMGCIEAATISGLLAARALGAEANVVDVLPFRRSEPAPAEGAGPTALPLYIDRPGEMALRPPYVLERVWMNAFVLRARHGALRTLLDRYLNEPGRGHLRYVPAAPLVVLAAAFADRAYSADPAHRSVGEMEEADIAFWVPAWAERRVHGAWIPDRLVWFLPHVFVTTGAAATAGREVYGFPKSVVDAELRRSGRALDRLALVGEVLDRRTPETRGRRARILTVERDDADRARGTADAIGDLALPVVGGSSWRAAIGRRLAPDRVTLAFLKQFRDVERTDRACYQAIVEADAAVRELRGHGPLAGTYRVSWGEYASHPFAEELGLDHGGQDALAATWVDFDFVMEPGREVFRAAA
jgi:uncharacterized protein with NAD-binding domain and iron-sulfur cluster